MENLTILEAIPLIIWAGNLTLILVLGVGSVLGSFWFRTKINFADKYQRLKWRGDWEWDGSSTCWFVAVVIFEFLIGFIVAAILSKMLQDDVLLPLLFAIGSILLLLYAPRFAIDLIKGLKINKKGDLERIDKLEKELQSLKEKASN